MKKGVSSDCIESLGHCTRGLELKLEENARRVFERREEAEFGVFAEQNCITGGGGSKSIASRYSQVCEQATEEALLRGKQDEIDAKNIHEELPGKVHSVLKHVNHISRTAKTSLPLSQQQALRTRI